MGMKLKLYQARTSPAASIKSDFEEPTSPQIKLKKQTTIKKNKMYNKKLSNNQSNTKPSLWKRVSSNSKKNIHKKSKNSQQNAINSPISPKISNSNHSFSESSVSKLE